jgi:hypothetical protein
MCDYCNKDAPIETMKNGTKYCTWCAHPQPIKRDEDGDLITRSVFETGVHWVRVLQDRGEEVVMPTTREPYKDTWDDNLDGYIKGKEFPWAGSISRNKDGSFDICNDFQFYETVPDLDSIGLANSACWYEWCEKKHPMPEYEIGGRVGMVLADLKKRK